MTTLAEQFVEDLVADDATTTINTTTHKAEEDKSVEEKTTGSLDLGKILALVSEAEKGSTTSGLEEHELVNLCMNYLGFIKEELSSLNQTLRKEYGKRFPELDTLVSDPIEYAKTASIVGNDFDLSHKDLSGVLPQATIITVAVTSVSTLGRPLTQEELDRVVALCREVFDLYDIQTKLLSFVESRMSVLAPNVTAAVGSSVAAQLIGLCGGVENLSKIPACNVQTLGSKKTSSIGFSTKFTSPHEGFIFNCPEIQSLPYGLRKKANRLISAKVSLAARVDAAKQSRDGRIGRQLKEEIEQKFEKWQEPPPAKTAKPLPIPDEKPKKRRGGRRLRKQKELYAMTELRKQQNRMAFGKPEDSYGNDIESGFGMIGNDNLRVQSSKTDSVSKAANRKLERLRKKEPQFGRRVMSGIQTSLSFSSGQGIELGTVSTGPGGVGLGSLDQ
eukprot:jgi/Galph1/1531/GphlegSOOS_G209.1